MGEDIELCSKYEYNYYDIASVVKTIRLIELLVQGNGELSVTEIARALDTHTSSADRYLLTLQNLGYAEKNLRDGKFRMSEKLIMLNNKLITNHPLTTKYLDVMHRISNATYEGEVLTDGFFGGKRVLGKFDEPYF